MSLALVADADLVARCREGDQQAWNELVNRFSRYVYAITTRAYRMNQQDSEDVFQEVFARTFEHLDSLRDDAAVRPWIGTLTRRLCVDKLRSGTREHLVDDPDESLVSDDGMAELDEAMSVHDAMRTLPEFCAEILDRFFTRDESYKTIGEALELPPGTIASRISRCLSKLRKQLEGRKSRFEPSLDR
jgi:RNA polymerase sigma-70 factor (ECF subfamily)